jgi:hypothetical protein
VPAAIVSARANRVFHVAAPTMVTVGQPPNSAVAAPPPYRHQLETIRAAAGERLVVLDTVIEPRNAPGGAKGWTWAGGQAVRHGAVKCGALVRVRREPPRVLTAVHARERRLAAGVERGDRLQPGAPEQVCEVVPPVTSEYLRCRGVAEDTEAAWPPTRQRLVALAPCASGALQ